MTVLDLTLPTPAANLACDEALLEACDAGELDEVLRFWESACHFVVVGYADAIEREVNVPACQARRVPILRRCSGGGAVLQGPGCLNYSLVLRVPGGGPLATATGANRFIMERHRDALQPLLGPPVRVEGHTDLTVGGRKFSGNAQRRRRRTLLFHGTFLLGLDLDLVESLLRQPARQPSYRRQRRHLDFLTNVPLAAGQIKAALRQSWAATGDGLRLPAARLQHLLATQYENDRWLHRVSPTEQTFALGVGLG
jgi:lipoate-protein ligase A